MEAKFKDRKLILYTAYEGGKVVKGKRVGIVKIGTLEVIENPLTYKVLQDNNSGCYLNLIHKNKINKVDDGVAIAFNKEEALKVLKDYLIIKREYLIKRYNDNLKEIDEQLYSLSMID